MKKNSKHRFRPQKQKTEKVRQTQELRRSNATTPHRSADDYQRRPKHRNRGWIDD